MPDCLIGLGSNVGDRPANLRQAVMLLADTPGIAVDAVSRWHATAPVGGPAGQGEFFNGALRLQTELPPEKLLALLQGIENQLGRERGVRWDARTLDLDLLLYGDEVIDSPSLVVPHPRMALRRFVLAPAAEIAGEMLHPELGRSVQSLLRHARGRVSHVALVGWPSDTKDGFYIALGLKLYCVSHDASEARKKERMEDWGQVERSGQFHPLAIEFSPDSVCEFPAEEHPVVRKRDRINWWTSFSALMEPNDPPPKVLVVPPDWNKQAWVEANSEAFELARYEAAPDEETADDEEPEPSWQSSGDWDSASGDETVDEPEEEIESEDEFDEWDEDDEIAAIESGWSELQTLQERIEGVPILRVSPGTGEQQRDEIAAVLAGM